MACPVRVSRDVLPLHRKGVVIGHALIDPEDFARLGGYRWYLRPNGYVARQQTVSRKKQHTVLLHREVMGLVVGDGHSVDHINHDKLDNRKANLRVCTHAENHQNLRPGGNGGTSQHRGVCFVKTKGRWQAYGRVAGRQCHVGYFDTEAEANEAAIAWRAEHMPFAA